MSSKNSGRLARAGAVYFVLPMIVKAVVILLAVLVDNKKQ